MVVPRVLRNLVAKYASPPLSPLLPLNCHRWSLRRFTCGGRYCVLFRRMYLTLTAQAESLTLATAGEEKHINPVKSLYHCTTYSYFCIYNKPEVKLAHSWNCTEHHRK
jgi:hypothetical protein